MKTKIQIFLFIIILSLSNTILYYNYPIFGIGDDIVFEFFVKQMENPSLVSYDWTYPQEFYNITNYRTFINQIYYFFIHYFKDLGLYIFFFINITLIYTALYILSYQVWMNRKTALLTIVLLHFSTYFHLQSLWIYGMTEAGPASVVKVFLILSILFILKKNYVLSIIITSIAALFHFSYGINFLLLIISFLVFLFFMKKINYDESKKIIITIIICVLIIILTFFPLWGVTNKSNITPKNYVNILGKFWGYGIDIDNSWDFSIWATIITIIFIIIFFYKKTGNYYTDSFFVFSTIMILIMFVSYYILTELYYISLTLIHLHWYRMLIFLSLYSCIYLANGVRIMIERNKNYLFIITFYLFILFMSGIRKQIFLPLSIISSLILIILFKLKIKNNLKKYYSLILINKIFLMIIHYISVLLFIYIILRNIFNDKFKNRTFILLFILLIIQIIYFNNIYSTIQTEKSGKLELYNYIANNVSNNGEFLVPFSMIDFNSGAGRISFIDAEFITYVPHLLEEYDRRYNSIFYGAPLNETESIYNSLTESDIDNLKSKYRILYAIFKKPKELNYSIVFENDEYILYDVYKKINKIQIFK